MRMLVMAGGLVAVVACESSDPQPQAGCKADTDCKGDRICEKGECVAGKAGKTDAPDGSAKPRDDKAAPSPSAPAPKPLAADGSAAPATTGHDAKKGCDAMLATICATCGESSDACTGWKAMVAQFAGNMPASSCDSIAETLSKVEGVAQAKTAFCASSPMATGSSAPTATAPTPSTPDVEATPKPKPAAVKPEFAYGCKYGSIRLPSPQKPRIGGAITCTLKPIRNMPDYELTGGIRISTNSSAGGGGDLWDGSNHVVTATFSPSNNDFEECGAFVVEFDVGTKAGSPFWSKKIRVTQDCPD